MRRRQCRDIRVCLAVEGCRERKGLCKIRVYAAVAAAAAAACSGRQRGVSLVCSSVQETAAASM